MANRTRTNRNMQHTVRKTDYYIDGNTVRKLAPQRELERPQEQERREVRVDHRAKRNRQRELVMNPGYVAFLTVAVIATVLVTAGYIYMQSNVSSRMSNVASLESQVLDLRTDNNAMEKRIETAVNLTDIRNKAINELGMVYPTADQIIYYQVDANDYMEQFQDIP